jgi:glycosyltransferase involved in cell wall biosynthesis
MSSSAADGDAAGPSADPPTRLAGLSVVIPCFNEEETLRGVITGARLAASEIADDYEVIVVDDGSSDASGQILDEESRQHAHVVAVHHQRNLGFGAAQQTGFDRTRFPFVTVIPSDGQFPASSLPALARLAPDNDIVIGYREERGDGHYRSFKTRAFWWTMRILFGVHFRDINWVKMYRIDAIRDITIHSKGIGIEAEMIVKARQKGLRLAETKVGYRPRVAGVAKGDQFLRVVATVLELVRLRGETLAFRSPRRPHPRTTS